MASEKKITLTPHQEVVFNELTKFVDSDSRVFILKGYAGTGKTTLMKTFINFLRKEEEHFKLLASTGRAAKILRDITGTLASTVHSELYTFKDFNQDLDKKLADKDGDMPSVDETGQLLLQFEVVEVDNSDYARCIYIIDESSMISDVKDKNPTQAEFGSGRLLDDLLKHDSKGKFVFVGDICQLPPINSSLSPALSSLYFKEIFHVEPKEAELTQIMRQEEGNDIVVAASVIRDMYNNPPPPNNIGKTQWVKFPLKGYNNITICPSEQSLIDRYIDDIKENGYENATMICRSNTKCGQMARHIRSALGMVYTLHAGDLLIVNQNNYISGLVNGDMVKVIAIGNWEERACLTFQHVEVEEIGTKRRASQLMIMDILGGYSPNLDQERQKALFIDYFLRMKKLGIKQNSPMFKKNMMEDPYLNALRANYGYAVTCHKSQGGEWKNVYLSIPGNLSCNAGKEEFQWLYTAMTRAKQQLFIQEGFFLSKRSP